MGCRLFWFRRGLEGREMETAADADAKGNTEDGEGFFHEIEKRPWAADILSATRGGCARMKRGDAF